jgi:KUP system potassium uptake protein
MDQALQTAATARPHASRSPLPAAVAALGIVYGDIGTSPLYAFKQAADSGGTLSPDTIAGIVSLILWSLIMIISAKYAILIMRADNRGEGGIVALLALLEARHARPGTWRASLLVIGLIGAALLYGDGVITPAISVLSAVEGLKVDAPRLAPMVVPISVVILVGRFHRQHLWPGYAAVVRRHRHSGHRRDPSRARHPRRSQSAQRHQLFV